MTDTNPSTHIRWLVIWYDGQDGTTEASLIDDDRTDPKLPFGITPEMVDPRCTDITAMVLCADPPNVPYVIIDDEEYKLSSGDPVEDALSGMTAVAATGEGVASMRLDGNGEADHAEPLSGCDEMTPLPDLGTLTGGGPAEDAERIIAANVASDALVSPHWDRVKALLVEHLAVEPEKVLPDARLVEDLGADSMDIVELVMAFEEDFGVEISDDEGNKFDTVASIVYLITAKKG